MRTGTLIRARPQQPRPPELQSQTGSLDWLYSVLGQASTTTRLPVTERTVNGLTGVSAAVAKIANACSLMMVGAEVYAADGRTQLEAPNILADPCTGYDSFTYWREIFTTGLMRGNAISIKADFDPITGYPRQAVPVPIDAVYAAFDTDGYLYYEIGGEHFSPDELVHVKIGLTLPGEPMAIGVIEAHRRNLSGMLDMQTMASDVWRAGAVPSGVVQIDVDLPTVDQVNTVKTGWIDKLGGQRTVAVLGKRMSYSPVSWSAEDAEWLGSRQFAIAECALMFGLRPEDLGSSFGASSGALSYGNRTDDALQRITDSYLPIVLPVEQQWSRLIPGKNYVMANVEALLRSTTRERLEIHLLAQQAGIETVDESREIESKPPLPKPESGLEVSQETPGQSTPAIAQIPPPPAITTGEAPS